MGTYYDYIERTDNSGYDLVELEDTEEDRNNFRKWRIERGWVPENATEEEIKLIKKVAVNVKT